MKKLSVLIAILVAAMFVVGCASTPKDTRPSASDLLAETKSSAPVGALVGQATASSGQKKAEQNAMAQIIRGMMYIVGEMVDEQVTAGRLTAAVGTSFKQTVNNYLGTASLVNVTKVDSGVGNGDAGWAVYALSKDETLKEITKAVNLAKESVAAGNFNFNNFDAKFAVAAGREWK